MFKKVKICLLLLVLIAPLFVTGCITSNPGPKFTSAAAPASGKAIIYVYRQRGVMTAQEMPGIKINDDEAVNILPEISYFTLSVEPGQYTFSPKLFGIYKTTEAVIDAQAGEVYYVRLKVIIGHLELEQMNKDEAMAYMATCYQLDPKYYRDPRVIKGTQVSTAGIVTEPVPEVAEPVSRVEEPVTPAPVKTVEKVDQPLIPAVKKDSRSSLYVDADPSGAKIRIMNISPRFEQGIRLDAGRYDVEVSAPGYVTYREWASMEKGEEVHLQVNLIPEQKKVAAASQEKSVLEDKKTTGQQSDLSSEEKRYSEMLQSGSVYQIRNAAKYVYRRYYKNDYLTGLAEQALLQNYTKEPTNTQIDAMAWLCKALGRSGNKRFSETLKTVAENAPHRKLKGYAQKSLDQL